MKHDTRPGIFDGPAPPLLLALEDQGFDLRLVGGDVWVKPLDRLTAAQRDQVRQYGAALRLLLAICDDGTQERVAAFKQQFADTPADSIPSFLFKPDLPYVKAVCFSCGTELPEPRFGRCARCALAWRLVAGVDIPAELAAAVDEARVA